MEQVLSAVNWVVENYQVVIGAIMAILSGAIAISLLIPGPEPERTLQKIVDILKKMSAKK